MSGPGPIFGGSPFGGSRGSALGGQERRGAESGAVDLNLTPLMDVMSNILFFLLASFGAAIVSFLAVSVPVEAEEGATPPAPRTDQIVLSLSIGEAGYRLRLNNEALPREQLDALGGAIPRSAGKLDRAALTRMLLAIKSAYPGSDTVLLAPDPAVVYEDIISALETARDTTVEGKRMRLFPKAVIADVIKAVPE